MQNRIRAWCSLFLSAIFFITVLIEYIPTPQDIIEFTFLANFGISILLLLTALKLFRNKKNFPSIVFHTSLVLIMLVFIICLIGLSGIYQTHFEGEFFFLHAVNPVLFLCYSVIFVEKISRWKSLLLIPIWVIFYLLLDVIYGIIRGKFIYNLFETETINLIKLAGAGILSYNFVLLTGLLSLLLHSFLRHIYLGSLCKFLRNCQETTFK